MSMPSLAEPEVTFSNLGDKVEELRLYAYGRLDPEQRGSLGQYFTPAPIAAFMAGFFESLPEKVSVLDPGAGAGMLTAAFTLRALSQTPRPKRIEVTAYEVDPRLIPFLKESMNLCEALCRQCGTSFAAEVIEGDCIRSVPPCLENGPLFGSGQERFDCVIMNPPYKKIHGESTHRRALRALGLETVNLYTGFLWLAAKDLKPGGQLVSINPRSFANGPYYRPFRQDFCNPKDPDRFIHLIADEYDLGIRQRMRRKFFLPALTALVQDA